MHSGCWSVGASPLPQDKVKEIIGIDIFILFVSDFCIRTRYWSMSDINVFCLELSWVEVRTESGVSLLSSGPNPVKRRSLDLRFNQLRLSTVSAN